MRHLYQRHRRAPGVATWGRSNHPVHRQGALLSGLWFVAGIIAVAGAVGVSYLDPSTDVVLVAALATVLALPLLAAMSARTFDPFAPLFAFALAYGAMFVVRPAAMISRGDYGYLTVGRTIVDVQAGFRVMLVIALFGAVGFVLGYLAPVGHRWATRLPAPPRAYSPQAAAITATGFAFVGVTCFVLFLVFAGGWDALGVFLSGRSNLLSQLTAASNKYLIQGQIMLLPASVILLALGTAHRSAAAVAGGAVSLVSLVLIAAPTGSRILLLPLFVSCSMYYYLTKGRRPRMRVLLPALLALLAAASLIGTVRTADSRQTVSISQAAANLVRHPGSIFDLITTKNDAGEAPGLAAVLALPGQPDLTEWAGGAIASDFLTRPIPRAIWANKPAPARQVAAEALFGRRAATLVYRPAFSVLLEPYVDGGYIGVLLLMGLYGIVARLLYEYMLRHQRHVAARLLFVLVMPALIGGVRDDLVDTVARLVFLTVPLVVTLSVATVVGNDRRGSLGRGQLVRGAGAADNLGQHPDGRVK